jgi:hypothetical protein
LDGGVDGFLERHAWCVSEHLSSRRDVIDLGLAEFQDGEPR